MVSPASSQQTVQLLTHHGSLEAHSSATSIHHHPFHQIEYIRSGMAWLHCDGRWQALPNGAAVLLPPLRPHGFRFGSRAATFFALKFEACTCSDPPLRLEEVPGVRGLLDALVALLPLGQPVPVDRRLLCEKFIAALLRCLEPPPLSPETGLAHEIARACAALAPRRPTVDAVAARLGLSRRGLHDRCRRLLHQSARAAIDAWLLSQAEHLLRYGAGTLDQIAATLGFADAFSFSRFFRRMHAGRSPGRWRRRHQRTHAATPP